MGRSWARETGEALLWWQSLELTARVSCLTWVTRFTSLRLSLPPVLGCQPLRGGIAIPRLHSHQVAGKDVVCGAVYSRGFVIVFSSLSGPSPLSEHGISWFYFPILDVFRHVMHESRKVPMY